MKAPQIPEDESERIEALRSAELLDTPREPIFDNLTKLVADVFNVPIVAISLVDTSRQWFKSIQGLDVCETSREVSFCGHVVHAEKPIIVEDARTDSRFADNPLVCAAPSIVFYAGVPIHYNLNGKFHIIGTLCIIDTRQRSLDDKELKRLKAFAYQIELLVNLRLSAERAETANQTKTAFLANMSHELRTPMSGVVGILDILQHNPLTDEQKQHIELARKSGAQMLSVINDILDFSKIEAGKISIQYETFDLGRLFDEVIDIFKIRASSNENRFRLNVDWPEKTQVIGDTMRLKQVLFNLLANADKFTQNGEIDVEASLLKHTETEWKLECAVRDTGIGIAREQLSRLFKPFEQLENKSSRRYGGTGLGLIISKRLCEMMGGDITVDSVPDEGTTFRFSINLVRVEALSEQNTLSSHFTPQDKERLSALRVLVVEDDLTNRTVIEYFLSHLNINFDTAITGTHARDLLRSNRNGQPYDLILMDCQIPEIDGYELAGEIRAGREGKEYIDVPIIALTANALRGDKERCFAAGMSDYVTKPIELEVLIDKLNIWSSIQTE